ncbi:FGGY carbohydrate kinase domain-containing protein [Skeletonema marinoi]|uniref:FGGY carbohydrate kinase domain-containing protein n=1 Tax=Skeletonema marinoi TaxID=267567 RepID=A0AAD9DF43_9STRA|nr:FGGY carbohydrate kinase domain-containing protein [Skeletonema marinoi]
MKLYEALGMKDLADKLPKKTLAMEQAASDLNLSKETLVVQGGPDAFVGMIGLGTIRPGQLCLITGSSHLHCLITNNRLLHRVRGEHTVEHHLRIHVLQRGSELDGILGSVSGPGDDKISYKVLDDEAAAIPPGSDGLVALETWQGSRTPHTDPLARGAFAGLTLAHSRAHMFRSILEAVCYGTRACFDALETAASQSSDMPKADEVVIAGGATRSPLWLQLHADITGAVLLSMRIQMATIRLCYSCQCWCRVRKVYDRLYNELYLKLRPGVKEVFHAISEVRGGDVSEGRSSNPYIISPSLLAADWSDMKGEVQRCIDAGVSHLHVDVFDGVYLDSPMHLPLAHRWLVQSKRDLQSTRNLSWTFICAWIAQQDMLRQWQIRVLVESFSC